MSDTRGSVDHVTPYDRLSLDEPTLLALLAAREPHEGLVEYFGPALHAELALLARATSRRRRKPGRRVYVLPGIMGSQLGLIRGDGRPPDVVWLDPIDIALGRLTELILRPDSKIRALGAMSYSYLKLTLRLRKAGYDAVLLDYDWRRDTASAGKLLAERIAHDGAHNVALIGHSMGGLVARAALTHEAGKNVSQLLMLGTPNSGSLAAVQALRGTYSVVRKIAMLDLRHNAEELSRTVFSTFAGLHELLPADRMVGDLDLFDANAWPSHGPGPNVVLLAGAAGLRTRLAPADARCIAVVGCNRTTATGVALKDGEFEYEYSQLGDGTVPMELARLAGARHYYVECGHSDMPLNDRVIAGAIDLLNTGATQRFAASPPVRRGALSRVRDGELREQFQGKVDWPHMSPEERRLFLDTLNEAPRGRTHARRQRRVPNKALQIRVQMQDIAATRADAAAVAVLRGVPAAGAAADVDRRLGGAIADWLQHRVVSGDAGSVTPIPRSLRRVGPPLRTAFLIVGLGRFDRLGLDVVELAAENLGRFARALPYRSLATVAWGAGAGIETAESFAAQLRGLLRARDEGKTALARLDLHVLTAATARKVHARLSDLAASLPPGTVRLAPLPQPRVKPKRKGAVPRLAHLIVSVDAGARDKETWRTSLLTGGSSAAIYAQAKSVRARELAQLTQRFESADLSLTKLATLGEKLGGMVLHEALREALKDAPHDHLSIVHDSASSGVPWETLNIQGWVPALEGGMSRRYATADLVPARFDTARSSQRELAVLVIANPTGDLPGADLERQRIAEILGRYARVRHVEISGEQATLARVTAEFESGRHDVIHYAGHADFEVDTPGEGGLLLHDGVLTGATLAALGRLPPLVVFNACESARLRRGAPKRDTARRARGMRTNLTLAETLLRSGLAHYIGTHWPVDDASAAVFGEEFYAELLRGTNIGHALVKARRAVHKRRSPDWADYVHYGDATFRLKK